MIPQEVLEEVEWHLQQEKVPLPDGPKVFFARHPQTGEKMGGALWRNAIITVYAQWKVSGPGEARDTKVEITLKGIELE